LLLVAAPHARAADAPVPELLKVHRVDIGGRAMNLVCAGHGSPAVIFDQGWGETTLDWSKVFRATAAMTKACVYDRAGQGYSDPSDRPSTPGNVTDDLHRLLARANLHSVILVGHSIGGRFATLHTDRFPSDVAGLVLVDPSFAGQGDYPQTAADKAALTGALAALKTCAAAARNRQLSRQDPRHCFSAHPDLGEAEIAYLLPSFLKPDRWEALRSELELSNGPAADGEARAAQRSWGDLPVVVLTHDLSFNPAGEPEAEHRARSEFLKRGHDALAARSRRGRSIVVPGAGHNIQVDRPEAVIAALRTVLAEARATSSSSAAPGPSRPGS
jgi:pimeloyl-ACP methyl ester carboxylesterase